MALHFIPNGHIQLTWLIFQLKRLKMKNSTCEIYMYKSLFLLSVRMSIPSLERQSTVRLLALMLVAGVCFVYVYTPPAALVVSASCPPSSLFIPDSLMQGQR